MSRPEWFSQPVSKPPISCLRIIAGFDKLATNTRYSTSGIVFEMIFYACDIPENLTYDVERDVWIRFEGDLAVLGMTDVAQTRCGKLAAISFRDVGKKVTQGKALATIESAKWVGPFPAPFSCEIVETNREAFAGDILITNREPYTTGWLVKVRPTNLEAECGHLVTGEEAAEKYKERIKELKINCLRCID